MSKTTTQHAADIINNFGSEVDLEQEQVEESIRDKIDEYLIAARDAKDLVEKEIKQSLSEDAETEEESQTKQSSDTPQPEETFNRQLIEDIDTDAAEHDYLVEVIELWEPTSENIGQVGLIADGSDVTKFTIWENLDLPELKEGEVYKFKNAITNLYDEQYSLIFNNGSEITHAPDQAVNGRGMDGVIVDIQHGSGLIKRCPEDGCTRVIRKSFCQAHGKVEGEFDLRIKAVIDNGLETQDLIFNREMTEQVMGFTLEEAKQQAKDALDTDIVQDNIEDEIVGDYYKVKGTEFNQYLIVKDAEEDKAIDEETLNTIRSRTTTNHTESQSESVKA
jgi:replication factor A1